MSDSTLPLELSDADLGRIYREVWSSLPIAGRLLRFGRAVIAAHEAMRVSHLVKAEALALGAKVDAEAVSANNGEIDAWVTDCPYCLRALHITKKYEGMGNIGGQPKPSAGAACGPIIKEKDATLSNELFGISEYLNLIPALDSAFTKEFDLLPEDAKPLCDTFYRGLRKRLGHPVECSGKSSGAATEGLR